MTLQEQQELIDLLREEEVRFLINKHTNLNSNEMTKDELLDTILFFPPMNTISDFLHNWYFENEAA